jgi:Tfp pilus assembly protein PilZ
VLSAELLKKDERVMMASRETWIAPPRVAEFPENVLSEITNVESQLYTAPP